MSDRNAEGRHPHQDPPPDPPSDPPPPQPDPPPPDLSIRWYSHDDSCTFRRDPITIIFYYRAYQLWVSNHLSDHLGWGITSMDGDHQYYDSFNYCGEQHGSRATGSFWQSRYHIRWREAAQPDPTYQYFTMGTPHYDQNVDCGHAVPATVDGWSGFDWGRQTVFNGMSGPHYGFYQYVGNTRLSRSS